MRKRISCLALGLALAAPPSARAAGYGVYEAGAAVLGMAGAGTASVDDASAVFYNPAALTRLLPAEDRRGLWYLGGTVLSPVTSFAGTAPYPGYGVVEKMEWDHFPIPAAYYAHRLGSRAALGVGVSTPFGLGVDWQDPDRFTGRYIVTEANIQTVNVGLSTAYQVTPAVSVALGGNVLFSQVRLANHILQPYPGGGGGQVDVAKAELESDWEPGYGWNAAVALTPMERWRIGASYRGKVVAKPDGDADFTQIPTGDATFDALVAGSLPPDQRVSTVLRFPAIWALGVAWIPAPWKLEADLVFTEWSLFRDLPITFQTTPENNSTLVEDYDDALAIRLGAEHRLESFTYRFGYYFEQEAAPSESVTPILPDAPRHGVTLGLGFDLGASKNVRVDLYDLALFLERRGTEGVSREGYDGEYKTFINAAGVNVGFHW